MPNKVWNNFAESWDSQSHFTLKTSGSTGKPKNIKLLKSQLIASANATINLLKLKKSENIYCCLPLTTIGGFMLMTRALILKAKLQIAIPNSNPISQLSTNHSFTFISLTPMMLNSVLNNANDIKKLNKFNNILVGGGEISLDLLKRIQALITSPVYHSYGMTETCSHIAVKRINGINPDMFFKALDGVKLSSNEENCLIIEGEITNYKKILTNDIVKFNKDYSFEILGRKDFIINTGGVKYCAEEIEKFLLKNLNPKEPFMVFAQKHPSLGEQVCILTEPNAFKKEDLVNIKMPKHLKYAGIKRIYIGKIHLTKNGKINRKESVKALNL